MSPLYALLEVVCCCLHTFKHDIVCQVTELHLSTKFHAALSEIRELNQNKEKKKNYYFQFKTFPEHIIYPFLNLLSTCTEC